MFTKNGDFKAMVSNTKLHADQKTHLKNMRVTQNGVTVATDGQTTIAYREFKNTVEFSLAVTSPDEKKFRVKVGEFHARMRLDCGISVKMETYDFFHMMETVFYNAV